MSLKLLKISKNLVFLKWWWGSRIDPLVSDDNGTQVMASPHLNRLLVSLLSVVARQGYRYHSTGIVQ